MKLIRSIFLMLALALPASAQFTPDFSTVTANTDGTLRGPTNFFPANSNRIWAIIGTSNYLADLAAKAGATNATIVGATLAGTTVIPSGSALSIASGAVVSAAPGSVLSFDQVLITKSGFLETNYFAAAQVGFVIYKTPQFFDNLAALKAAPVSMSTKMSGYVMASTAGDGAAGPWIWDPASTTTVNAVCVRSDNVPSGAGRWLKF